MSAAELQIERVVYGGFGLARRSGEEPAAFVPFTLAGEIVEAETARGRDELQLVRVVEASTERVQPGCPHFGVCGGCHLQMASYAEQLRIKSEVLRESLERASVHEILDIATHAADPWHYRNRIRLHVTHDGDALRFGYRERASTRISPIFTCPIAAPLLWRAAEALLQMAQRDIAARRWIEFSSEVELFCNGDMSQLQITLLASGKAPPSVQSFQQVLAGLQREVP